MLFILTCGWGFQYIIEGSFSDKHIKAAHPNYQIKNIRWVLIYKQVLNLQKIK